MPGKLNLITDKSKREFISNLRNIEIDVDHSEIGDGENMSESEFKSGGWFKTWPEANYDKLEQNSESSPEEEIVTRKRIENSDSYIPLNKLLDKIPLAYSPITKQLHVLMPRDDKKILRRKSYQSLEKDEKNENRYEDEENIWTGTPAVNESGKKGVREEDKKISFSFLLNQFSVSGQSVPHLTSLKSHFGN